MNGAEWMIASALFLIATALFSVASAIRSQKIHTHYHYDDESGKQRRDPRATT